MSSMKCPSCGSHGPFEDGFCNVCGLEQPSSRLPVKSEGQPLPALWQQAAPVLARGAALVAVGIAAEWLLRSGTKRALSLPFAGKKQAKNRALARKPGGPDEIVAISETVVTRRVLFRRQ
jgi:hypothetical protein